MTSNADQLCLEAFFTRVMQRSGRRLLMLDYDGTLAPFNVVRELAVPYPGVTEVLNRIITLGRSRVVIISGRNLPEVLRLLDLETQPEIWGSHGWERRLADGTYSLAALPPHAQRGLEEAHLHARTAQVLDFCERKPVSIALHWRGLDPPKANALRATIETRWLEIAQRYGLQVHGFDGGLELRPPGRDKGSAVRALLAEMGAALPVAYLGDDATDEDAFAAVGGVGLGVLVRPEHRPTRARVWLRPPDELLAFLEQWRLADES